MRTILIVMTMLAGQAAADPCEADLPRPGATFGGAVTHIIDGDGLCVGAVEGGIEVRLADFNAPELNEAGGKAAKDALARIALGRQIACVAGKRSWDRVVAHCMLDGRPLGDLMRDAGVAEGGR